MMMACLPRTGKHLHQQLVSVMLTTLSVLYNNDLCLVSLGELGLRQAEAGDDFFIEGWPLTGNAFILDLAKSILGNVKTMRDLLSRFADTIAFILSADQRLEDGTSLRDGDSLGHRCSSS